MTKGVLVFAHNNNQIDYVKQAYFLAHRVSEYLGLPTTLVTDSKKYLLYRFSDAESVFDNIITVGRRQDSNDKVFNDGAFASKTLQWRNGDRPMAFELTPYDETLVLDTDVVICNDTFLKCFDNKNDLLMYKDCTDITGIDRGLEFVSISDTSVDFYWATAMFFRKTAENEIFFGLVEHIKENWDHYRYIFQLRSSQYRNDFSFSIAVHIMNGYQSGHFVKPMPGTLYYITDKSLLYEIKDNSLFMLLEKLDYQGEYTALRIKDANVHVMNKFSLNRCIDEQ